MESLCKYVQVSNEGGRDVWMVLRPAKSESLLWGLNSGQAAESKN